MKSEKAWICNPYKNKKCQKTICGILDERDISNPHRCFLTRNSRYRLEPNDADKTEYIDKKERIERWVMKYYGKEDEVNEWRSDTN